MIELPQKENIEKASILDIPSEGVSFGGYLRSVRKARGLSVRDLARAVHKTATYISDIENGNNKPPDKPLLDAIINELSLFHYPKIQNRLFDLAGLERHDVPADIKEYIIENSWLISAMRTLKFYPCKEQDIKKILLSDMMEE